VSVSEYVPKGDDAVQLPVDELAFCLLRWFVQAESRNEESWLNSHNILLSGMWQEHDLGSDPRGFLRAISDAWAWLVAKGLVARKPDSGGDWMILSRRGRELGQAPDGPVQLRAEERLDVDLHPRLEHRIRRQFLLGEYDLAAFAAMREVEIVVREAGGFPKELLGMDLMAQAFKDDGPLSDPDAPAAERQAVMSLFRGAIGLFKNPSSHREVEFEDPTFAAEVVLLADLLLRLLDEADGRRRVRMAFGG
jgi:uncharacterized protein (TIGR02391 family)